MCVFVCFHTRAFMLEITYLQGWVIRTSETFNTVKYALNTLRRIIEYAI